MCAAGELLRLLNTLAPKRQLSAWPWTHFSFAKLWAALLLESYLLPVCMAYTLLQPHVQWAGITYRKSGGKVAVVPGWAGKGGIELEAKIV